MQHCFLLSFIGVQAHGVVTHSLRPGSASRLVTYTNQPPLVPKVVIILIGN